MFPRPNVIVLILDTLRARNMSCYGYPVQTTPHIDAFARESVLFRRAISAATWTVPSHASLLSGLYVSQHRVESIKGDRQFHESIVPLPAALRRQGYRTAAFSQNMLFSPSNHLDGGFDAFYDVEALLGRGRLTRVIRQLADRAGGRLRLPARYVRKLIAPRVVLDAMHDWVDAQGGDAPFFLFANILAPHFPWTVPPTLVPRGDGFRLKYLLKSDFLTLKRQWEYNSGKRAFTEEHRRVWQQLYDASVRHVDREIGRFLARLRRLPGWEHTIVVVTADHGELMGDYRDIVGHMLCLSDRLIHVPLIVRHPEYRAGLVVEGVVQTLDVYASVLEWAGCATDGIPAAQLQRPALSRAVALPSDRGGVAFAEEDYSDSYDVIERLLAVNPAMDPARYPRRQVAARSATHKFVWYDDRAPELFHVARDADELLNVYDSALAEDVQARAELQEALSVWRSRLECFPPRVLDDVDDADEETLSRLRGLGYVA